MDLLPGYKMLSLGKVHLIGQGGMKIWGGAPNIFRHPKGGSEKNREGSENLYTSKPTGGGGAPKKLNR